MLITEQFKEVNGRDEIIISDYDGVMQLIEIPWIDGIKHNREYFKHHLNFELIDDEKNLINNFINRPTYYLNNWLAKTPEDSRSVQENIMKLYNEDPNFYHKMPFTKITMAYAQLSKQKFVKKIIFLSHYPKEIEKDFRKEEKIKEFIEKYDADGTKIEYVAIPSTKSKGDWIKENCPDYTVFIDDRMDIVKDVIEKTEPIGKIFLIPRFGYSHIEDDETLREWSKIGNVINNYENFV